MDLVALVREHLAEAHPDLVRSLLETFVEALMGVEVDAICGAAYHHASPERTHRRKRVSQSSFAIRGLAPPEHAIPKRREGSYLPDWIQARRVLRKARPTGVLATCVRARGLDTPARAAGQAPPITKLPKSQILRDGPQP
jgi:putative transposase